MKFRKVTMLSQNDEWVLDIAGQEVPMIALKTGITALFIVLVVFLSYNIGQMDAQITLQNLRQASLSNPGEPYVSGTKIMWNSTASSDFVPTLPSK
jgi:hypothetical protein